MFVNDPTFGKIVDFERLRPLMRQIYDQIYPEFNLLGAMMAIERLFNGEPSYTIAAGASMLAYMQLVAAEEHELAEKLKDGIFTLGWTEEHAGSDLLSLRTKATPMSDSPDERQYYIQGKKWLINNSYHGDYHIVVAKTNPEQNGPRSLSLFVVPRSSTRDWKRIETHVLENMVLTEYTVDGPGTLVGKVGHGLSIIQRMAMPSKYQCTYVGVDMVRKAVPATLEHLATKRIFGENPVRFSNVFRQLYNIVLQSALIDFTFHRALVFNDAGFLQFQGTFLKAHLLLRINELLSDTLLVAGSKGFLKESSIGKGAIDSFVLPVFDGHYTINTLMTAKHAQRYLNPTDHRVDLNTRMERLRSELYMATGRDEINARPNDLRKPDFFDYADYIEQMQLPVDLQPRTLLRHVQQLANIMQAEGLASEAEYRYKTGDVIHTMELLLSACDMWKLTGEDNYVNGVIQQYNRVVTTVNTIISEGNLDLDFLTPMRQLPLPQVDDPFTFLMDLHLVKSRVLALREAQL